MDEHISIEIVPTSPEWAETKRRALDLLAARLAESTDGATPAAYVAEISREVGAMMNLGDAEAIAMRIGCYLDALLLSLQISVAKIATLESAHAGGETNRFGELDVIEWLDRAIDGLVERKRDGD